MGDLEKVARDFKKAGDECGRKIAAILKMKYPNSKVFPLYRSAIAIVRDGDEVCVFASGDPHALGEDLNETSVESWTSKWRIFGSRWGPVLTNGKEEVQL